MKELPVRKPNRLKNFDYSSKGAYFITVCVKDRHALLVGAAIARPFDITNGPSGETLIGINRLAMRAPTIVNQFNAQKNIKTCRVRDAGPCMFCAMFFE